MPKSKEPETEDPVVEEPVAEDPDAVKVQYVGGHSEVRSSISGTWKKDEVKAVSPEVAERLLMTAQFEAPKGGK